MLPDESLALAAQDEVEKLLQRGRQRLAGHLVDVEIHKPAERVLGERHGIVAGRVENAPVRGDGECFCGGVDVGHARVAEAVGVRGHRVRDREHQAPYCPVQIGAPLPPVAGHAEHALAHKLLEPVPRVDRVDGDGPVCPLFPCQAELPPRPDRGAPVHPRRGQEGVQLLVCELVERVCLLEKKRPIPSANDHNFSNA